MVITDEQLQRVGDEVASLWGACCTGWHYDNNYNIIFECNEFGEEFETTPMSLADIATEYDYCL